MPNLSNKNKQISNYKASDPNPQIVYVLPNLGFSGGIKNVLEQANRMTKRGYNVKIHSLQGNLDWFNLKIPLIRHQDYRSLTTALKGLNAVKIATWWETAPVVLESCNPQRGGKGIPAYFVQDIESNFYPYHPKLQEKVKSTYHLPMIYFTGSKWVKTQLEENYNQETINIFNAINLDIFKPQPTVENNDCKQIIAYNKSDHLKNFDITKEVINKIANELDEISLVTFSYQFETNINTLPHTHHSRLTDEELAVLYNNSELFIHNSSHEDFGFPILEAMACGTPVVTTKANGNLEYCQDGYNCLLAPPNDINALTQKIKKVLTNHNLANKLAKNGVKTAQKYNWERTIDNIDLLISNTLELNKIIKDCIKKSRNSSCSLIK
ncbi:MULTISPECIES: glycosyltransferase family 4 protein [unclassified Candidatus Frackibacter]|uniref:glycosyltransferase family 4 protein n=1 Tax=unclassified Candidatus Frackibacter TaxID=2648818 RepID=UPI00079BA32F|nr:MULTISPECIES: glycosyltransferase family 4 protein [unclassified Candidatus Frackibacter]KXS41808.1 MAG: group 1 glycosyl transferase [Candidatus Frackibacter sp. T328-2]SDC55339.1 Glycosyltransferase involved in cell wall bisynthesis [Candidatus Frackibacter sp. WG11]SEM67389.1 Glycosyltransferase involved in cell wall bisynthesis [Candidatus Frackibacter sp. WG12]SFL78673.1 Glycosyltransferase involved in cell wall bisynthesis [Candidatus Frackibacter sp. WG13]